MASHLATQPSGGFVSGASNASGIRFSQLQPCRAEMEYDCLGLPERVGCHKHLQGRAEARAAQAPELAYRPRPRTETLAGGSRLAGFTQPPSLQRPRRRLAAASWSTGLLWRLLKAGLAFDSEFCFSQWASALPRLLLRTRTSFSLFLTQTFCLCRDDSLSISTALFPLPIIRWNLCKVPSRLARVPPGSAGLESPHLLNSAMCLQVAWARKGVPPLCWQSSSMCPAKGPFCPSFFSHVSGTSMRPDFLGPHTRRQGAFLLLPTLPRSSP